MKQSAVGGADVDHDAQTLLQGDLHQALTQIQRNVFIKTWIDHAFGLIDQIGKVGECFRHDLLSGKTPQIGRSKSNFAAKPSEMPV